MGLKGILQLIFAIFMIAGLISMLIAFNDASQKSMEAAQTLDFDEWGESIVRLFMVGITFAIIGAIGEVITLFVISSERLE